MSRKIKITWVDAVLYGPERPVRALSRMETTGWLERETAEYLIVRRPETLNRRTGKAHPVHPPTYYFIPKVLIESVEEMPAAN